MKWCLAKITTILTQQLHLLLLLYFSSSSVKANLDIEFRTKQQHETDKVTQLKKNNLRHHAPFQSLLPTNICPIDLFLDKIFYFSHDIVCWKVDFAAEHGGIQGDSTNPDCLNNIYVTTDTYSSLESTGLDQKKDATFQLDGKGEGYNGVIEIKTSDVGEFKAIIVVSKNDVTKRFHIDFLVPECFSLLPLLQYNTSPKKLRPLSNLRQKQRSLKVRIEIMLFLIELF